MIKPTDKELFHILSMVCVISVLMTVVSIILEAWSLPGLTHAFFSAGAAIASFVFAVKFKSKMAKESHETPDYKSEASTNERVTTPAGIHKRMR